MDFLWEYLQSADSIINKIIQKFENSDSNIFKLNNIHYKKAFANHIWEIIVFSHYKDLLS